MLCSYRNKTYTGLRPKRGHLQNAKIKVQSAKLRNPDLVGMGVLVVASFSISRILYLLDVYYISKTVGCQVNSPLTADYADPFGKLRTGFADYTDLGIRVYKCMRIYLWGESFATRARRHEGKKKGDTDLLGAASLRSAATKQHYTLQMAGSYAESSVG